jgi:hypothetical protein
VKTVLQTCAWELDNFNYTSDLNRSKMALDERLHWRCVQVDYTKSCGKWIKMEQVDYAKSCGEWTKMEGFKTIYT